MIHKKQIENWISLTYKTSAIQKVLLREWKNKSQTDRKFASIYKTKNLNSDYIMNSQKINNGTLTN